jgi:hypothetical protein
VKCDVFHFSGGGGCPLGPRFDATAQSGHGSHAPKCIHIHNTTTTTLHNNHTPHPHSVCPQAERARRARWTRREIDFLRMLASTTAASTPLQGPGSGTRGQHAQKGCGSASCHECLVLTTAAWLLRFCLTRSPRPLSQHTGIPTLDINCLARG